MISVEKLNEFPKISLESVNQYFEQIDKYSDDFASHQVLRDRRPLEKIKQNTQDGYRCKVASALINGLDVNQHINFTFVKGIFDTFINGSDIKKVSAESFDDSILKISIFKDSYEKMITRMEKGKYADFVEFMHYDNKTHTYYHLGKFKSSDLPQASSLNDDGQRVILEFKTLKSDGNVFTLTENK